nr:MAG TPA: hypothetical protein [Caudoviricetes sp.]
MIYLLQVLVNIKALAKLLVLMQHLHFVHYYPRFLDIY